MNALLLALAISSAAPHNAPVVKKPAKQLVCGAPQALATDAVQTVKVCEYK